MAAQRELREPDIDDRTFEFAMLERANVEWRKNQNDQRIIRRALLLVRAGEYSAAVTALENASIAPAIESTLAALRDLHPAPSCFFSPEGHIPEDNQSWRSRLEQVKDDINEDTIDDAIVIRAAKKAGRHRSEDRWEIGRAHV